MPQNQKIYSFTLILSGANEPTEQIADALFEAGCDDALLGSRNGVLYLDFDREASTLDAAVLSAIKDVKSSGAGLQVVRVESGELVTAGEIARRVGQSRESIRLYAQGKRGPGGFPLPIAGAKSRSPIFRWSDVATWMARAAAAPGTDPETVAVDFINAMLNMRRLLVEIPAAKKAEVARTLEVEIPAVKKAKVARTLEVALLEVEGHPRRTKKKGSPKTAKGGGHTGAGAASLAGSML